MDECESFGSGDAPPANTGGVQDLQEKRRARARESRGRDRHAALASRRFSSSDEDLNRLSQLRMPEILVDLARSKFNDFRLLERLKTVLADEASANPEEFFTSGGEQNLYSLVNVISGSGNDTKTQLSAVQGKPNTHKAFCLPKFLQPLPSTNSRVVFSLPEI